MKKLLIILVLFLISSCNNDIVNNINSEEVGFIYPTGSEVLFIDDTVNIKWKIKEGDFVRIEFSLNDGISWLVIYDSILASLGKISWIVPQVLSSTCKLKITSINSEYDSKNFSIKNSYKQLKALQYYPLSYNNQWVYLSYNHLYYRTVIGDTLINSDLFYKIINEFMGKVYYNYEYIDSARGVVYSIDENSRCSGGFKIPLIKLFVDVGDTVLSNKLVCEDIPSTILFKEELTNYFSLPGIYRKYVQTRGTSAAGIPLDYDLIKNIGLSYTFFADLHTTTRIDSLLACRISDNIFGDKDLIKP